MLEKIGSFHKSVSSWIPNGLTTQLKFITANSRK